VVVGGDEFQSVIVRRSPESVALSSPVNATGLFELEQQSDMLLPFEPTGVDALWEFQMPKAANPFDYSTIADVLVTIEYTALSDPDYRQQVIQTLHQSFSADRAFSFRHQLADQWYDLHNPTQSATPMTVRFTTERDDFPPNLEDSSLSIEHVALYFARADRQTFEVTVNHLNFTPQGASVIVGGGASSKDGVISTRRGNAPSTWQLLKGKVPIGQWELALDTSQQTQDWFANEEIEDILFVITYSGQTPPWPV